jgi:hypothetical protein
MKVIKTKKEYYSVMAQIETFLEKGFKNLSGSQNEELKDLSLRIEVFEKIHFPMPVQHDLIKLLGAYMKENCPSKRQI